MVGDLLEISRIDAGSAEVDLEVVQLGVLLDRVARTIGRGAIPVTVDEDVAALHVAVDKRRFERVIANLVDNADRYGGGAVCIGAAAERGTVRLWVDDEGPGVPPADRERIFERFARGSATAGSRGAGGGTGLGLALVQEHVKLHGGRVWAEERPGGGARFVVELPLVEAPETSPGDEGEEEEAGTPLGRASGVTAATPAGRRAGGHRGGSAVSRARPTRPGALRRLLVGLALLGAGAALAGCGIPLDANPIAVPTGNLPLALKPSPNSTVPKPAKGPPAAPCNNRCVTVFFTGAGNLLVGNVRYLDKPLTDMTLQQGLQAALNALIQGPTNSEGALGESTWLSFPKPLPVLQVLGVRNGVVYVELDELTTETDDYAYEYALGQIVWTLAGTSYFPGVRAVGFEYDGAGYPAILPNGELDNSPVTRQDFRAIAPQAS